LREFLDETALAGRDDLTKDDEHRPAAVTLMTLHSAKGLEFPHVYMVGMEEGLMPHRRAVADSGGRAIAEERRLCYVGITRARDTLTLSFCKGRMKLGVLRAQIPSRFLMEMRGDTEKAQRAAEAAERLLSGDPTNKGGAPAKRNTRTARESRKKKTAEPATESSVSKKPTPKTPRTGKREETSEARPRARR
jgi:ATP-dependent exoDNAse (exonuclease V) beta subunit